MIERYTRPEMARIWSEENKYHQWLEVELAAAEALAQTNDVPPEAARLLRKHASFDLKRIQEIEREVKHDVIAFTTAVSESLAAADQAGASRWLHYGLTSNDIVDTAQALMVRSASDVILQGLTNLAAVLKTRAFEFKDTVQIGRTHGIHAEPITFGLKLALWYDEMQRNLSRFSSAAEGMRVGKISGAVGTFGHIGPQAEERICQRLGLRPARHRFTGHLARSPRQLRRHVGADRGDTRKDRPRDPAPAAHRSSRSGRAILGRPKGLVRHAAQAEPRNLRADLRTGPRSYDPTLKRPSRTSRFGTSATFPIRRSSASSYPIPLRQWITCWLERSG